MSTGVKQYNAELDRSMILARCGACWNGQGASRSRRRAVRATEMQSGTVQEWERFVLTLHPTAGPGARCDWVYRERVFVGSLGGCAAW